MRREITMGNTLGFLLTSNSKVVQQECLQFTFY